MSVPDGPSSRDVRRQQLLEVALTIFADKGYHAASIADIIDRAGVARGTFYNYFKSKREIFQELLDQLFGAVTAGVIPIRPGARVGEQVRENIETICRTLLENLPMARMLLEQAAGVDEDATLQLRSFYLRIVDRVERAVRTGQEMGIVRAGDPPVIATCIVGMIKESLFQRAIGTSLPPLDAVVTEIFRCMAVGILAPHG